MFQLGNKEGQKLISIQLKNMEKGEKTKKKKEKIKLRT